jgi:tRNA(fMet)-specific endonuclease VapC
LAVLDTNVCIYVLKGRAPRAAARILETPLDRLAVTAITAAELRYGAERSARRDENLALVEAFLSPFNVVPFDDRAAQAFAPLKAALLAQGKPIGPMDLLIASIALAAEATVVTANEREFRRVAGLRVENWAAEDLAEG